MKTILANQVKRHFACFARHGQYGITTKQLTYRKVLFQIGVSVAGVAVVSLAFVNPGTVWIVLKELEPETHVQDTPY